MTTKPVALTMGDPAGVGLDITLMTWLRRNTDNVPPFAFLGDAGALRSRAKQLRLNVPAIPVAHISEAETAFTSILPVLPIPVPLAEPVEAGSPSSANAAAVKASIEAAVALAQSGEASAAVTNPIAKHVMAAAGFPHPGHTEFLGALARDQGANATPVMMLCGLDLRVVPVTIHIALADVPSALTPELIASTARIVAADLRRWFGIDAPRLAVTGLNPHAGEGGLMGTEEQTIIAPAIAALQAEGYAVTGPHPADALFHARARQNYDAAIAMYHDQALIPLKTLAFDEGVNVTLGLPFVRTSPDHGTAFDIAGKGKAHPDSLIAALKLAAKMGAQGSGDSGSVPAGSHP
ncbi:MAG: 4-hydroxythreonine-4-phosphate dehydrogenase PdxA [Alphaproteobacteria bacterium]